MTIDTMVSHKIHMSAWTQHVTQKELAQSLGMSETNFSKKMRGNVKWSLTELYVLSDKLGVSLDELLPAPSEVELPHLDSNQEPCAVCSVTSLALAA